MTQTTAIGPTLRQWRHFSRTAFGRWMFARRVGRRAPYFATIDPRFLELRPGFSQVSMAKRHALAMGNLVELAAGIVTEVTIPPTMRWIPRGMTIEYLRKATSDVSASARLDKGEWPGPENVGVPVSVHDAAGAEVVRAVVTVYVSPRN